MREWERVLGTEGRLRIIVGAIPADECAVVTVRWLQVGDLHADM